MNKLRVLGSIEVEDNEDIEEPILSPFLFASGPDIHDIIYMVLIKINMCDLHYLI